MRASDSEVQQELIAGPSRTVAPGDAELEAGRTSQPPPRPFTHGSKQQPGARSCLIASLSPTAECK